MHNLAELVDNESIENSSPLLDLASNDYLGLSTHPNLIEAATKTMLEEGVGAGGSRLVTGSRPIHKELEESLGEWIGREHVLLFPSGFQANLAAVIALSDRETNVFADKLIHHSLLMGVIASRAKLHRYDHNNISDLEQKLKLSSSKQPNQKNLVITESLFSMEGTSPPLKQIISICERFGARLLIDEAHSIGVMGHEGKGLCYGITEVISIISGTFGKAFGSGGAFLASNKRMGNHLIQTSGAFRYTTALAPPLAAASLAALKLIQANPTWGKKLQETTMKWRDTLQKEKWRFPEGNGPIIPLILGSEEQALKQQEHLESHGLLTIAIRPPTVPEGSSRLRLVIRRDLPEEALQQLVNALNH